jgi:hypothetical protein
VSVWDERDHPVLRFLADQEHQGWMLETASRSHEPHPDLPQLTRAEFHRAVETLDDAGFVHYTNIEREGSPEVGGVWWQDFILTGEGKQALGDWPYFDALGQPETLAAILERLAEYAPTEEEAQNYRRTATAIRALGAGARAAITGAISATVRGELHLPF